MSAPTVVILAAGEGTRMRSATPKVLHPVCGRPMVLWPVLAAQAAGAGRVVVVDNPNRRLREALPADVEVAIQEQPLGTGDAMRAAIGHVDPDAPVIVLYGDVPLVTAEFVQALAQTHATAVAAATVATMVLEDPTGYGRVVRGPDGGVERVVETKVEGDATPEELAIDEVNTGLYAFEGRALIDALGEIRPDNAQGELYLPDVLPLLRAAGRTVAAHVTDDPTVTLGVNDRADLAEVVALAQQRIHLAHMRAGVTIVDPGSTLIEAGVTIGPDTTVEPSTFLRGTTSIGAGCAVGPLTTLIDCRLGDGVRVPHSYLQGAQADHGALVGPFAYLRPGAHLHPGAKAGTFVEIKNSDIGAGAKVPHLSYVGDTAVGEKANLGAGTITANYDGQAKHRTTIGARVKGGVHVSLVAPVEVGDDAYTAAGSVITQDVPAGALAIARSTQANREGYADKRARRA
jgi:bifunctional UDP-N-acetylglucosamine pyrophosphorylase/glucosamine-1-phosphate N-acetyltransferase